MDLDMALPSSSRLAGRHRRSVRRLLCLGLESRVLSVVCRSRSEVLEMGWGWAHICEDVDMFSISRGCILLPKRRA